MAAYSGRVLLRMPRDIHRAADRRAQESGTSLNTWLTTAIARELGHIELPKALKIVPGDLMIFPLPGAAAKFKAVDERGEPVDDVEWSLSRRGLGAIDDEGRFTPGKIAMAADVIARKGELEARASVHVVPIRGVTGRHAGAARSG